MRPRAVRRLECRHRAPWRRQGLTSKLGGHMKGEDHLTLEPSIEIVTLLAAGVIRADDRVLDVGCFQGDDVVYLGTAGCYACGVDTSRAAITYARRAARVFDCGNRAKFRIGKVPKALAHFKRNTFDVVSDRLLLSNIDDRRVRSRYVNRLAKLLKPDGLYILRYGVPAREPFDGSKTDAPRRLKKLLSGHFRPLIWSRDRRGRARHEGRGVYLSLSPARAGFHRDAWLSIYVRRRST